MFQIDLKRGANERDSNGLGRWREWATPLAAPVAALATLFVVLWILGASIERTILDGREQADALQASVEGKRRELAQLTGSRRVVFGIETPEAYWSDVLRSVSRVVPDKLWIDVFHPAPPAPTESKDVPAQPAALLTGGVLSDSGEANLALIANLLADLGADPSFASVFGPPSLESVRRDTDESLALSFRLRIPLK